MLVLSCVIWTLSSKIGVKLWLNLLSFFILELALAEYGHLLDEAKDIAKQFLEVEFDHVLRQANKAAHNIVRHARHVNELSVWMENVSLHLFPVIHAELAFDQ